VKTTRELSRKLAAALAAVATTALPSGGIPTIRWAVENTTAFRLNPSSAEPLNRKARRMT
jgi:hypothetical protein